jgi:hypothetical protein
MVGGYNAALLQAHYSGGKSFEFLTCGAGNVLIEHTSNAVLWLALQLGLVLLRSRVIVGQS